MEFQPGNNLWELRKNPGRDKKYSPEELWEKSCEYFKWMSKHTLHEVKYFHVGGKLVKRKIPKMRAMTISSLCLYLGITRKTWWTYSQNSDFLNITSEVEDIIYTQKLEGAAADLLNANIIARELGLADKKVIEDKRELTPWSSLDCGDEDED